MHLNRIEQKNVDARCYKRIISIIKCQDALSIFCILFLSNFLKDLRRNLFILEYNIEYHMCYQSVNVYPPNLLTNAFWVIVTNTFQKYLLIYGNFFHMAFLRRILHCLFRSCNFLDINLIN